MAESIFCLIKMSDKKSKENYLKQTPDLNKQKPSKIPQYFTKSWGLFLVIAFSIGIFFLFWNFQSILEVLSEGISILMPIIAGCAIAYLLLPMVKTIDKFLIPFVTKKFKWSNKGIRSTRLFSIVISELSMLFLIFLLFYMLIPEIYRSVLNVIENFSTVANSFVDWFSSFTFNNPDISIFLTDSLEQVLTSLETWMETDLLTQANTFMSDLTIGVIGFITGLTDFFLGIIISIYVLYSRDLFSRQAKKLIYAMLPCQRANLILHITKKSNAIFGGFITGKIIDSIIIGILCAIGMTIFNFPYVLLISVIIGVTNFIPFFGPFIGGIPCALLLFLIDPLQGLYFALFVLFLQQLDGNVIGPRILGESTGLPSFWVIVAILVGGGLFGFAGMVMGVPTFAVIYYLVTLYINQRLGNKKLPIETDLYTPDNYVDDDTMKFVNLLEPEESPTTIELEQIKTKTKQEEVK